MPWCDWPMDESSGGTKWVISSVLKILCNSLLLQDKKEKNMINNNIIIMNNKLIMNKDNNNNNNTWFSYSAKATVYTRLWVLSEVEGYLEVNQVEFLSSPDIPSISLSYYYTHPLLPSLYPHHSLIRSHLGYGQLNTAKCLRNLGFMRGTLGVGLGLTVET